MTADGVVEHVQRVRAFVQTDGALTVSKLVAETRQGIDWQRLSLADRMLLDALIAEIQYALEGRELKTVKLVALLEWVEYGARYADNLPH